MSESQILFLSFNIVSIGLSSYLASKYVNSEWFRDLKTPSWLPPAWLRAIIWIVIIFTFSTFMSYLYLTNQHTVIFILIYLLLWSLKILWNLTFFKYHKKGIGLMVEIGQLTCISSLFILSINHIYIKSILILPFLFWLIFSCAFNVYIFVKN